MFQFATFALHTYVFSMQWPYGRVSPFGNLRINVCLLTPRSLSQATTSFIAWYRQGIHHVHLVTCPYNFSFWCLHQLLDQGSSPKTGYSSLLLMSITLAFAVSQGIWFFLKLVFRQLFQTLFNTMFVRYNHNPSIISINNCRHWLLFTEIILIISTLLLLNC